MVNVFYKVECINKSFLTFLEDVVKYVVLDTDKN